jgi:hypothetical protein
MEPKEIWVICPNAESKYDGKKVRLHIEVDQIIQTCVGTFLTHSRGLKDEYKIEFITNIVWCGSSVMKRGELGQDACDKIHPVEDTQVQFEVRGVLGAPLFDQ